MGAAAAQPSAPKYVMDRITGNLTDYSLDGPRQRDDGSNFWIERYMIEKEDGSAESCSRFLDNDGEVPLAATGEAVDFKVKRRGDYADVVPEDYDTEIETTVQGKVLSIEREGPRVSAKGNEWFIDWYEVENKEGAFRIRRAVFDREDGHLCAVGDEVELKVKQKGNFPADIIGLVRPEVEEIQGKVMSVRRVGPKVGPSGKEFTLEFYTIETRPGVTCTASRFVSPEEPALAEKEQPVLAVVRYTAGGYVNLLSLSVM